MAGDWIKMRSNLVSHPRVKRISEVLALSGEYQDWSTLHGFIPSMPSGIDEEAYNGSLRVTRYVTVCALLKFWCYANEHARDEFIRFLTVSDIDEISGVPCFGLAMEAVGWVVYDAERGGVFLPNFNEFNNVSSDRTGAERQRRFRESKKSTDTKVTDSNAVTSNVTRNDREEKRREDNNKTHGDEYAADFVTFWAEYPNKANKAAAYKAWRKLKPSDSLTKKILGDIAARDWKPPFIPHAGTYLNNKRWEDEAQTVSAASGEVYR